MASFLHTVCVILNHTQVFLRPRGEACEVREDARGFHIVLGGHSNPGHLVVPLGGCVEVSLTQA